MQVPSNACCVGGPVQTQPAASPGVLLVLAAVYGAGALIVFGAVALAFI